MAIQHTIPKCNWSIWTFEIHGFNTQWQPVPGLYIFSKQISAGRWLPIYIGQASSLRDRLAYHERQREAMQLGATSIHARREDYAGVRDLIEQQLVSAFNPTLNCQYRSR